MFPNKKLIIGMQLLLGLILTSQGMAAIMTLENGQNVGTNGVSPGPMAASVFPTELNTDNNRFYHENGLEHTAIAFSDPNAPPTSHIHGAAGNPNLSNSTARVSELAPDAGGALFRAVNPGQRFSFNSWDFDALGMQTLDTSQSPPVINGESTLEVRGFLSGNQVASTSFDSSFAPTTQLVSVDFLNLDGGFANVDLVEYWFAESGRGGVPGQSSSLLKVHVANINFDLVAVPVPAAMYLFASGLMLLPVARRRS